VESGNDVFFVCQFFGCFTEMQFNFEVFLEIIFAEFIVQLNQIVELFSIKLVILP